MPARTSRRVLLPPTWAAVGILGTLLALIASLITAPAQAAPLPAQLRNVGDARQIIIVTADNWSTSTATLSLWTKRSSGWTRDTTMKARLGWSGFQWASQRRQGDGSTPAGTFTMTRSFGLKANPGTKMPYRQAGRGDYWAYDPRCPRSYNTWQKYSSNRCWRTSWAEKLTAYTGQYNHAVIINFNMPTATRTANTKLGGGIFLHIHGKGATAGCVSVSSTDMRRIMRWLDPAKKPRIAMGPRSVITRV
jgi:L,D-peptidoglycan transpeptidase YkuD (ErfK/YbiS/YcfS/YnhG family)